MSAALPKCPTTTSSGTPKSTCSPVSAGGATRSGSRAGPTTGRCGPAPAPASRSATPVNAKEQPMPDISGPPCTNSSPSAHLQRSLESRLRARTAGRGSPEYALTWKHWDMLSGPPICALRASGRRTSGNGSTGWPTPNAMPEGRGGLQANPEKALQRREQGHQLNLDDAAVLAGWPSPKANNNTGAGTRGEGGENLQSVAVKAGWCSPTAQDHSRGDKPPRPHETGVPLSQQAVLAGWATPKATEYETQDPEQIRRRRKECAERHGQNGFGLTNGQLTALGTTPSGSLAPTEKRGALNPDLSRWLMGFPTAWGSCGATVTRLSRRSRRNSSPPTSTAE